MAKNSNIISKFEDKYDLAQINPANLKLAKREIKNISSNVIGKPINTWTEIFKRFFGRKVTIAALVLFFGLVMASIIIPLTTAYNPNDPISSISREFLTNLPPSWVDDGYVTVIFDAGRRDVLDNLGVDYEIISHAGFAEIKYSPFTFLGTRPGESDFSFLGTDSNGYDIWTRLWVGTRDSLKLALLVAVVETVAGVSLGAYIGFHAGSKLDIIVMRIVEIVNSIPSLIWFILILFILEPGFWSMFVALVIVGWLRPVGTTRMFMLRIKDSEYIMAAESIGVSKAGRIFNHALLNILGKIAILFVRRIPTVIFSQASLAFLGLAADPNAATLGNVINDAKGYAHAWWYILAPTLIILSITLSLQMIAVGLHDAFDPKAGKK